MGEIYFWVVLCVFFPHVAVISSFPMLWIRFCNDMWLVFSPNVFVAFSTLISKLKIIFELSSDLEERPRSLGCG